MTSEGGEFQLFEHCTDRTEPETNAKMINSLHLSFVCIVYAFMTSRNCSCTWSGADIGGITGVSCHPPP